MTRELCCRRASCPQQPPFHVWLICAATHLLFHSAVVRYVACPIAAAVLPAMLQKEAVNMHARGLSPETSGKTQAGSLGSVNVWNILQMVTPCMHQIVAGSGDVQLCKKPATALATCIPAPVSLLSWRVLRGR
jgi:hypothetical protein